MQPETPVIPHTWLQWVWILLASALTYGGTVLKEWINKKRSPAEERKTDAEARAIDATTQQNLLQSAADALTKAYRVQDVADHWQRKAEEWERRARQAEDDAKAAVMFQNQLHAAAKLTVCEHHPAGVRLSDHLPSQLNPPKQPPD